MSNASLTTRPKGILAQLESPEFAAKAAVVLGRAMTPERFCSIAVTYVRKNPTLQQCDPTSFFACAKRVAELGLNLDGRDVYLVPYKTECTLVIGYIGEQKLAMRSGEISKIRAEVICENDEFAHNLGKITVHTWDFRQPRGAIVGAYCQAIFKTGEEMSEILAISDIDSARSRSKVQNGAWRTDFAMMARKTAIHRLCRRVPWVDLPPEADDFIDVETVPSAKGSGVNLFPKQIASPEPEPEPFTEPPAEAPQPPAQAPTPAKAPKTPSAPQSAPTMTAAQPRDHLAAIRARLAKEGIVESDFAGFQGVGELASLDNSELAKIVLNLDAEIAGYRNPQP